MGEKEIIERQQQLIADEEKEQKDMSDKEMVPAEDIKESEEGKKRIKDLAESVETLTTKSAVDSEKADLAEIKEKLQEITDETEALWKELDDGMEDANASEDVLADGKKEKEHLDEIEFDLKEDEIKFVDVNKEMKNREKVRGKLEKRISKMVDKQSKLVEDTEIKFLNTLKKFHEEEKGDIDIEELKAALNESSFSHEKFWHELHDLKEREPDMPLSKRIEVLIDQYEEDIDIKDIKQKDKGNKAD